MAVAEVPPRTRSAEGLPDGAVTVLAVDPTAPASASGLRAGDVILGDPDEPVRDRGAMKLFLAQSPHGATRTLAIDRHGQRLKIDAQPRPGEGDTAPAEARDLEAAGRSALAGLESYRGPVAATLAARKPYLLFFWATWCKFCKDSVPELLQLERERGIPVVAITDERPALLDDFFRMRSEGFPPIVAVDQERRIHEALDVRVFPTFILIDEYGRVQMRDSGYQRASGLGDAIWGRGAGAPPAAPAHH
jgi:thiol-disulfide isomerase/thioredoxin